MRSERGQARAVAAAGLLTMLFGALLILAPGAGAEAGGNDTPGPPGDNGTVKIDGLDLNDGPGHSGAPNDPDETDPDNDPHVTCGFQVEFFNFDLGQTADIVFTAHPPTGTGGVLLEQLGVVISDDGTGGANNDPDAVFDYDVLTDFDTSQFTSVHAEHGWHVKLHIQIYDADGNAINPGGKKHKVYWVEGCQPPPYECPSGTDWVDANQDQVIQPEECEADCPDTSTSSLTASAVVDDPCEPPFECPSGTEWVDANRDQVMQEEECQQPCPPGTSRNDAGQCVPPTCTTNCVPTFTCEQLGTCPPPPPPPPPGPEPSSLTVVKQVAGDAEDIPEDWSFPFTIDNLGGAIPNLTDDQPSFSESVTPGSYTITETDDGDAVLTDIACTGGTVTDETDNSIRVTVTPGDDVTCTFTNTYEAEVLPEVITPQPKPQPRATPPAVQGVQVTRQLPRTGSGSDTMVTAGLGLLVFGAALTLGSRRRLRTVA